MIPTSFPMSGRDFPPKTIPSWILPWNPLSIPWTRHRTMKRSVTCPRRFHQNHLPLPRWKNLNDIGPRRNWPWRKIRMLQRYEKLLLPILNHRCKIRYPIRVVGVISPIHPTEVLHRNWSNRYHCERNRHKICVRSNIRWCKLASTCRVNFRLIGDCKSMRRVNWSCGMSVTHRRHRIFRNWRLRTAQLNWIHSYLGSTTCSRVRMEVGLNSLHRINVGVVPVRSIPTMSIG